MRPIVIDNLFSSEELFFLYKELLGSNGWTVDAHTDDQLSHTPVGFTSSPQFRIKYGDFTYNYPLYLYFQSIMFRLKEKLKEKHIGLPSILKAVKLNITYHDAVIHRLHHDTNDSLDKTILLFLTPVWESAWKGSFYVDGEEFKFKPGSAVICDSTEWHTGEEPSASTHKWVRLTANLVVGKYGKRPGKYDEII